MFFRAITDNAKRFFTLSILVLMLMAAPLTTFAQSTANEDDEEKYVEPPNPYKKVIGGGLFVAIPW